MLMETPNSTPVTTTAKRHRKKGSLNREPSSEDLKAQEQLKPKELFEIKTPSREFIARLEIAKTFYKYVCESDVPRMVSLIENPLLDLNWRNEEDHARTALHVATQNGNTMVVALLLGKGADVCIRDADGRTALNIALDLNHKEILQLLANVTLSSLEETKRRAQHAIYLYSDRKAREEQLETLELLERYRKFYHPMSGGNEVDPDAITNQLSKIFERPKHSSIFNTHHKRKSPMTEMLKISHFQTIHNIFVAVFMISFTNTLISNFYDSGNILDFDILVWSFADFFNAIMVWLVLFVTCFTPFFLQKGIVLKLISPTSAYSVFALLLVALNLVVPSHVLKRSYPPATAAFVMCELVRMQMKMYSYLAVNKLLKRSKEAGDKDPAVAEYPGNVTLWNFFYFMWVPTLVYQTSYPRTKRIRWGFFCYSLGEALLCIIYVYAVFIRYIYPYRNDMIGDYQMLFLGIFKVMIPCIAISLLVFYLLLHSWFNAFAELTTFGDRHFYSDWWNVTNWAAYYRKWNFVVHNFLHRHLFTDMMVNFHFSKLVAMWITFILSAIIHEYIIAVCLGFYKPILFILFIVPGGNTALVLLLTISVFFIYLTRLFRDHQMSNIFFWTMMIIGHGVLFGLYYRQWYFYKNIPNYGHESIWSLIWLLRKLQARFHQQVCSCGKGDTICFQSFGVRTSRF